MARPGRPERSQITRSSRQLRRFHHVINPDEVFGTHTPINTKNVHRTNFLLGHPYGTGFVYDEMMVAPGFGDIARLTSETFATMVSLFGTGGLNGPDLGSAREGLLRHPLVNRRRSMTPLTTCGSETCRADRRRDPAPTNTAFSASSRNFDLNGRARTPRTKPSNPIIPPAQAIPSRQQLGKGFRYAQPVRHRREQVHQHIIRCHQGGMIGDLPPEAEPHPAAEMHPSAEPIKA